MKDKNTLGATPRRSMEAEQAVQADQLPHDDLPREVRRGVLRIRGIEIVVVHLDDGRRVIPPEGIEAFGRLLMDACEPLTEGDAIEIAKLINGVQ